MGRWLESKIAPGPPRVRAIATPVMLWVPTWEATPPERLK
jgi:hypothetical protein